MPTYDYECAACEHRVEIFQPMSEGAKRKCPSCGRLQLKRQIGAGAAVLFKGSGFYETDYKRNSSSDKASSNGDAGCGKPLCGKTEAGKAAGNDCDSD